MTIKPNKGKDNVSNIFPINNEYIYDVHCPMVLNVDIIDDRRIYMCLYRIASIKQYYLKN